MFSVGDVTMNTEKLEQACTRIFKNRSIVRYKYILINSELIFELPVIASELDIQYCTFLTVADGSEVWLEEIVKNKKPYFDF